MIFNESDLIAYQLHELSPRRTRALRRALELDPTLAAEAEAIAWTLHAFSKPPVPVVDAALLDRTWQSVRPSLPVLTPRARFAGWRRPLAVGAGLALTAAAVLWFAVFTTQRIPIRNLSTTASTTAPSAAEPPASAQQTASAQQPALLASGNAPPHSNAFFHAAATNAAGDLTSLPLPNAGRSFGAPSPEGKKTLAARAGDEIAAERSESASPSAGNEAVSAAAPAAAPAAAMPAPEARSSTDSSSSLATSGRSQPAAVADAALLQQAHPARLRHLHETDASIGGFAALASASNASTSFSAANSTVTNGPYTASTTETVDPAAGLLVAFHQQLRPYAGYQLAAGYSRQALSVSTTSAAGSQAGLLLANVYELSAGYVVRGPHVRRISTHAAAGAAALNFIPAAGTASVHHALRPAGLFTLGLDYHIKRHWSLRAEYRALFFKSPNLQDANSTTAPVVTGYTVSSEPTISLTYRFDSVIRP